jgi:hypothetical protein
MLELVFLVTPVLLWVDFSLYAISGLWKVRIRKKGLVKDSPLGEVK